jgi:coenzyme F420-reducing hydrogenase beta subunit
MKRAICLKSVQLLGEVKILLSQKLTREQIDGIIFTDNPDKIIDFIASIEDQDEVFIGAESKYFNTHVSGELLDEILKKKTNPNMVGRECFVYGDAKETLVELEEMETFVALIVASFDEYFWQNTEYALSKALES